MRANLIASVFLLVFLTLTGWTIWNSVSPTAAKSGPVALVDLPPLVAVQESSPRVREVRAVIQKVRNLLRTGDKAGLDSLAAQLRESRAQTDTGRWQLAVFYEEAVTIPESEPSATKAVEFYARWAKEAPESVTAQVCYGRALSRHAWVARGNGYADTVTEEGRKLYHERLEMADTVLNNAARYLDYCPGVFGAQQTVALGQGWPREVYFQRFLDAVRREPTYATYYQNLARWLLPRWYGRSGEYVTLIKKLADASPTNQRETSYATMVIMASQVSTERADFGFGLGGFDWNRTKRGLENILQSEPDNLVIRMQYIHLALFANDRDAVRKQLEITGGRYQVGSPLDELGLQRIRQFAFQNEPNPYGVR